MGRISAGNGSPISWRQKGQPCWSVGRGGLSWPPQGLRGVRGFEAAAVLVTCPEGQGGGRRIAQPAVCLTSSLKSDLAWGQAGERECLPSLPSNLGAWSGASSVLYRQPALFQSRKQGPWGGDRGRKLSLIPPLVLAPLDMWRSRQGSDLGSEVAGGDRPPTTRCGAVNSGRWSGNQPPSPFLLTEVLKLIPPKAPELGLIPAITNYH